MTYFQLRSELSSRVVIYSILHFTQNVLYCLHVWALFKEKQKKRKKIKVVFNFQDVTEFLIRRDDKHRTQKTMSYISMQISPWQILTPLIIRSIAILEISILAYYINEPYVIFTFQTCSNLVYINL